MPINFLPGGLVGLTAALIAWGAAWFVFTKVPNRRVAIRFALLLTAEGLMIVSSWAGPAIWLTNLDQAMTFSRLHIINDSLLVMIYLPTIAVVVDSRMAGVFGRAPWLYVPIAVGLAGALATIVAPDLVMGPKEDFVPGPEGWASFYYTGGPLWGVVFLFLTLSYTYGLIATIRAWRSAESTVSRRKNGILAVAFGTRDIVWGGMFLTGIAQMGMGITLDPVISIISVHVGAIALIIYVVLTAYGIASAQLFDIDLKVKWTIQRGTVAAAYVAFYFVVSEGTANFLTEQVGTVVGLMLTGLLVFAFTPIYNMAVSLSDRAMPGVQDTDEYRIFRKLQIYGEAFAEARANGEISAVSRAALNRLRENLELSSADVSGLEAELSTS